MSRFVTLTRLCLFFGGASTRCRAYRQDAPPSAWLDLMLLPAPLL
jgi:hypothetical protein